MDIKRVLASAPRKHALGPECRMLTPWGEALDPGAVRPEHPHPQFARENFTMLNGWWDYCIVPVGACPTVHPPAHVDGRILVPFSPEALLSGVGRTLQPDELLWYVRRVLRPRLREGERCLLHFEAADFACACCVNGQVVGTHEGAYLPFTFDITEALNPSGDGPSAALDAGDRAEMVVAVAVRDPSDEGTQLRGKQRLERGGPFPMFTSCCPAWVKYLENENPKYLKHISTCKSPMEMFAAILRDRYAEKDREDGRTTFHIAIMPCTAKKMEAARPEFTHDGKRDVDLVLTTQEVVNMIKESGIQLPQIELESPELPFGLGSGAGVIYGTTGGVAEAVVRFCLPDKSKNVLRELRFSPLRGNKAIRVAVIRVGDRDIHLAIVHGLSNAQKLLKEIEAGNAYFDLVEVMTCQGGCVGGAGQPHGMKQDKEDRAEGLYSLDRSAPFKRAERNPVVASFLQGLDEEKRHELLHVDYVKE